MDMIINRKLNILVLHLLMLVPCFSWAQDDAFSLLGGRPPRHTSSIDRKALVRRHNPITHHVGRQQFLLGESNLFFHVDATALQTFIADPLLPVNMGLNLSDTTRLSGLDMSLDRWSGKAESRFRYDGQYYHVETICSPVYQFNYQTGSPTYSTRITSDSIFEVVLSPVQSIANSRVVDESMFSLTSLKHHGVIRLVNAGRQVSDDKIFQWFAFTWRGNASVRKRGNRIVLRCKGHQAVIEGKKKKVYSLDITMYKVSSMPSDSFFNSTKIAPFTDFSLRSSTGWNNFWTETGIADFSAEDSPEARQMEGRLVEALYDAAARTPSDWWLQSPLTLYGFAKQVVPDMRRIISDNPEKLWRRPELIATALLTLRAYSLPEVAERFTLTDEEVVSLQTTVLNAFCLHVVKAADLFSSGQTTAPAYLDRDALLDVAKWWQEKTDSINQQSDSTSAANAHVLSTDSISPKKLFKLSTIAEGQDSLDSEAWKSISYLLSIAGRCWPENWKVATEYLLPLP